MGINTQSESLELSDFLNARDALSKAISGYISQDNTKLERSWYSTGISMMRFQINFYLKCLYDDKHHLNNQRAYNEMKHKYRDMESDAMNYIASLDAINHQDIRSIIYWDKKDPSNRIIATFEHDLLTHIN